MFTMLKKGTKYIPSKIKRNIPNNINSNNSFKVWGLNHDEGGIQYNFAVDIIFSYIKPNGETAQALRTFNIFAYSVENAVFKATHFFPEHLKNLCEGFDVKTTRLIGVNEIFIRLADFYLGPNNSTQSYDLPYKTTRWYEWKYNSDNLSILVKETPQYLFKYNCRVTYENNDDYTIKDIITFKYKDVIASSIENGILEAKKRVLHQVYINTEYKKRIEFRGVQNIYLAIDKNEYVGKIKTVFNEE